MITPLQNNLQRAYMAFISFGALAFVLAVATVSDFLQLRLLNQFNAGNIDNDAAISNDQRQKLISIIYLAVFVVCIVLFIMWFRRAYCNLERSGRVNLKYAEGWAAGAWFVPFLNLWRPYEIMKEIWQKTQEATYGLVQYKSGAIIGWWWLIYITNNVVGNFRIYAHTKTIDDLINYTYLDIVKCLLGIVAAGMIIFIIRQTSVMEEKLYHSYNLPIEEGEDKLADIII